MDRADNLHTAPVQNLSTLNREQRYRGVRTVASAAHDADDCAQLLDVLGLDAADGRSPSEDLAAGPLPVAEGRRIFMRGWLGYERS
ncbi:hypothetical protein [Kibdelosporangium phytohabitans]|uniref:Uncharacterized protein n=1 Tax=Kibdelosporangium phytohabitans TaxID=860235 RepID=A0A0N9I5T3_9PSEU|nr:hypothetical protein [Kibdelosporangium phytohabitans]ALG09947.1 hypothetical protein AOZ06_26315 [Kibdelosporangium phytohabitans]MBE1468645.1 hypothetical protein [Kibdelosporangium phytohabitans]